MDTDKLQDVRMVADGQKQNEPKTKQLGAKQREETAL